MTSATDCPWNGRMIAVFTSLRSVMMSCALELYGTASPSTLLHFHTTHLLPPSSAFFYKLPAKSHSQSSLCVLRARTSLLRLPIIHTGVMASHGAVKRCQGSYITLQDRWQPRNYARKQSTWDEAYRETHHIFWESTNRRVSVLVCINSVEYLW